MSIAPSLAHREPRGCPPTKMQFRAGGGSWVFGTRLSIQWRSQCLPGSFSSQELEAPLFSFPGIQRALSGAVTSHPHTCILRSALAGPSHCASTLFLQGACELVPESLPGTQEGSSSRWQETMSPFGHMGLGLCSEWCAWIWVLRACRLVMGSKMGWS